MHNHNKQLHFENLYDVQEFTAESISTKVLVKFGNFSASLIHVKAGENIDVHNSMADACIQIIEGEGRFITGDKETFLSPGVFAFVPAHLRHAVHATNALTFLLCLTHNQPKPLSPRYEDDLDLFSVV